MENLKFGDRVKVGDKCGVFHRYGQTSTTAIVDFDNSGLSFVDENKIEKL